MILAAFCENLLHHGLQYMRGALGVNTARRRIYVDMKTRTVYCSYQEARGTGRERPP